MIVCAMLCKHKSVRCLTVRIVLLSPSLTNRFNLFFFGQISFAYSWSNDWYFVNKYEVSFSFAATFGEVKEMFIAIDDDQDLRRQFVSRDYHCNTNESTNI